MIAKLILTALLSGVLLYAWMEYRRSPVVGLLSVLAGLSGLYFVWMPEHSTQLAELVGIGRAPRSGERAQDSINGLVRVRGARKLPLTPTLSPLRGARERTEFAARSSTAFDAAT